jgi:hypothetical protein
MSLEKNFQNVFNFKNHSKNYHLTPDYKKKLKYHYSLTILRRVNMADKNILEQMLSHLVNDNQTKAEELFHEYVVGKSREIYEGLIEAEMSFDEEVEDEDEDNEKVEEEFEDLTIEADDDDMDPMGGDATDDLASELDADDEDMSEKEPAELFQDLDAIVDELQAKFDAMNGDDEEMGNDDEMGDDEVGNPFAKEEDFELETVREYVEKVTDGHGAEKKGKAESGADNNGMKFSKNDMGGTTANMLNTKEDAATFANQGQLKGNGLAKGTAKVDDAGNINVPGAKNGNAFSKKEPGHGAEKKGAAEGSTDGQSLFRGRR